MKKSLVLLAVPALFFLGCKPKPTSTPSNTTTPPVALKACFNTNKTIIDSGETITTTNCSTGATTYGWNFGLGLQSSSTATAPSFTYADSNSYGKFNIQRGTQYKIELNAYNGTAKDLKDMYVTVGRRKIDSVTIVKMPVIPPYNYAPDGVTTIAVQFGPGSVSSKFTSSQKAPVAWPYTFNLDGIATPIIIDSKTNNQAWAGRIINTTTSQVVYNFSTTTTPIDPKDHNIYFSRGVNVSPIKVTDSQGFEMDVYYSLIQ